MSEPITVTGKIYRIGQTEQVTEKFSKREVIIEVEGQYPQYINIQFTNTKTDLLEKYTPGDVIKVHVNLRGRLYQPKDGGDEKAFTSLEGWRIETVSQTDHAPESDYTPPPGQLATPEPDTNEVLPF